MSLSYHLYASIYGKCNLHQITRILYLNIFFFFFFWYSQYFTSNSHLYVKIGHSVLPISSILQEKIRIT